MDNPIQQVLNAEKTAQQQVFDARASAERAVADAKRLAKAYLETTEQRLQTAVARFERRTKRARESEAAALKAEMARQTRDRYDDLDRRLDDLISTSVEDYWPGP